MDEARQAVLKNGGGAKSGRYKTQMSTVAGSVVYTKEEQTWNQVLVDAAKALKDFEEDNADSVKKLETYDKAMEKAKDAQKDQAEQAKKLKEAQEQLAGAQRETAIGHKEYDAKLGELKEKYAEAIQNIDESERKEKEAAEEKARKEAEEVEALYKRLNKESDDRDNKDELKAA